MKLLAALLTAIAIATPFCDCFTPRVVPSGPSTHRSPIHAVPPPPVSVGPGPTGGRQPIIAGNWKLNPATRAEAQELLGGIAAGGAGSGVAEVVVFPPLPFLSDALDILGGTGIKVGAQTAGSNTKGAFTGEIAPSMLASTGVSHVLLGHSERRTLFGETDTSINASLKQCLIEDALTVVLCVGETLDEYEAGLMTSIVDTQLRKCLAGVDTTLLTAGRIIVAYEPVWAIGTGLVATPDQAQTAHEAVRRTLAAMYPADPSVAAGMRIQYGGSVGPDSVESLMAMPDVDGALVGGASLDAASFTKIVEGACCGQPGTARSSPVGTVSRDSAATAAVGFTHAPAAFFSVDRLSAKGLRKGADVGSPHDSSLPLAKSGSTAVGSWWCASGGWPSPTPRATTEVFHVLSGHGCVTDMDGTKNFMGPGDLVVLPKGWAGRWDILEDIHKVWVVVNHPDVAGGVGAIVESYMGFAPQHLETHNLDDEREPHASKILLDNGHVRVGVWTYPLGSFPALSSTSSGSAFHLLEGVCFITNADGSAQRCVAGDTVFLPEGWRGQCDVIEPIKKIRVIAATKNNDQVQRHA